MHYQQINQAYNLGTAFAIICTIHYLLYDYVIFSARLILHEVIVLLWKLKKYKSLIYAVKFIHKFFTLKPEV